MKFLTLYTPTVQPTSPPTPEHMAKMMQFTEEMFKSGVLVATGGILSRQTGMKVTRAKGEFTVEHGPVTGSSLMPAAGFAILRADNRGDLEKHIKAFLELAGDGVSEVIQLMDDPPRNG